jgi:hypothetical protein
LDPIHRLVEAALARSSSFCNVETVSFVAMMAL